jgi:hypothetical protein
MPYGMAALTRIVAALQQLAADAARRGPLVGVLTRDGELEIRVPPASMLESPDVLLSAVRSGLRAVEAVAVAVVLPVRTLWGDDCLCDYLDAEALVLVAVEELHDGVATTGLRCALHTLPDGWEEAQESLRWLSTPLREALARRAFADDEL